MLSLSIGANITNNCTGSAVLTADMRLASVRVRARRAAEPSEPESEEATEPVHHEHSHSEHHEHSHTEHHPGHDYNHMKEKFMNELGHLPSKQRPEFQFHNFIFLLKYKAHLWFLCERGNPPLYRIDIMMNKNITYCINQCNLQRLID